MPRKQTSQFNYVIPTRLKESFDRLTAGKKKQDVVAAILEAFIKDPTIAGLENEGGATRTRDDEIGLVGGMKTLDYPGLPLKFSRAKQLLIYMNDYSLLWHTPGVSETIMDRAEFPDTYTKLVFTNQVNEHNRAVFNDVRMALPTHGDHFQLAVCLNEHPPFYNVHMVIDDLAYIGGGIMGDGPAVNQPYITIWKHLPNMNEGQHLLARYAFRDDILLRIKPASDAP